MYTHHKLKFFTKSEADYSENSLKLVVWIIDASRGVSMAKTRNRRKCTYAANRSGLSRGEQRVQRDFRAWIGTRRDEVAFNGGDSRLVPT